KNPLVWGGTSAVLGAAISTQGGAAAALFFVVAFIAVAQLILLGAWRNIRPTTVVLAAGMALLMGAVLSVDYLDAPYESPYETTDPQTYTPISGEIAPLDPPGETVGAAWSIMGALMLDLYSVPLSEGAEDPGPPPVQAAGRAGEPAEAVSGVDRLPELTNTGEAGLALAFHYPAGGRGGVKADTALLWLHVSSDGQVTPEGRQLIRSTSDAAAAAALATVPYMRFEPARKDGVPVGTWATQRFVIVP
ncbi:MAG TPA: hypothetical protein VEX86_01520, partial [Longimicrobium sp.]|nr:hypothetical protein [Longimicrobium sp.]